MSGPTLSVAMPNYNHSRFLPRAIESVLGQSRPPDEFLILDDASTDDSVAIIESYAAEHSSIRLICNERNEGVIKAHERLYELAAGDYLYSAAADDDRYPEFFAQAMHMAAQFPHAGLIFGQMVIQDEDGREQAVIESQRWRKPLFADPEKFLREYLEVEPPMQSSTAATIFRREAFAEVGWCRPELESFADTFACRAIALKHGACYVPERFSIWRKLTSSFSQQLTQDVDRAIEIVGRTSALMRSEAFRDRFPESYVRQWARRQKRQIAWSYFLGPEASGAHRSSFLLRNLRRAPRAVGALSLMLR